MKMFPFLSFALVRHHPTQKLSKTILKFFVILSNLAFFLCTLKVCESPTHTYTQTHCVFVLGGLNPQIEGDMLQHVYLFCLDDISFFYYNFKHHL